MRLSPFSTVMNESRYKMAEFLKFIYSKNLKFQNCETNAMFRKILDFQILKRKEKVFQ